MRLTFAGSETVSTNRRPGGIIRHVAVSRTLSRKVRVLWRLSLSVSPASPTVVSACTLPATLVSARTRPVLQGRDEIAYRKDAALADALGCRSASITVHYPATCTAQVRNARRSRRMPSSGTLAIRSARKPPRPDCGPCRNREDDDDGAGPVLVAGRRQVDAGPCRHAGVRCQECRRYG